MKTSPPTNKFFKIGLKGKIIFFIFIIIFLLYNLKDYSSINVPALNNEMEPRIKPGQKIYLYQRPSVTKYQTGDIIWAKHKRKMGFKLYRIIGAFGDKISVEAGVVFRNGSALSEQPLGLPKTLMVESRKIEEASYFLIYNNQLISETDSLVEGAYKADELEIKGKLFFYMPNDTVKVSEP